MVVILYYLPFLTGSLKRNLLVHCRPAKPQSLELRMSDADSTRRRVIIMRHAQTVENEHLILLTNAFIEFILHFRFPSLSAIFHALCGLLSFDSDSKLSILGEQQVTCFQL